MGYAVIHVHHVDGNENEISITKRLIEVQNLNFLQNVEGVFTPVFTTICRNNGIKNAIQKIRSFSGRSIDRRNDTSERRKGFSTRDGFVNFWEAIKMRTRRLAFRYMFQKFVRNDFVRIQENKLISDGLLNRRCGVLRDSRVDIGVLENVKYFIVIVLRFHQHHTSSLVCLTNSEGGVSQNGFESGPFIPNKVIRNKCFFGYVRSRVDFNILTVEVKSGISPRRGSPGTFVIIFF